MEIVGLIFSNVVGAVICVSRNAVGAVVRLFGKCCGTRSIGSSKCTRALLYVFRNV